MKTQELYDALFLASGRHELYDYQIELLNDPARFIILNKSRQIGISSFLACYALVEAVINSKTVLVVSPSERQSKHVMDYVHEYLRAWHKYTALPKITARKETTQEIQFDNAGMIVSLPNSAATIRGYKADIIILDEFAHFLNGTDKEVYQAITPSISRGGRLYIVSTPFGDNNLFYDFWNIESDNFKKYTIPYTSCPDLDIESIRSSGTYDQSSFEQEFLNAFIGEMTSEFPRELIMTCVDPELEYKSITDIEGRTCVGGWDVARDKDLSIVNIYEVIEEEGRPPIYVSRCKYVWKGVPYRDQRTKLTSILGMPKMLWFNMDDTANKEICEDLKSQYSFVRGVHFTNEIKAKLVSNLKQMYEERRLRIPDDPALITAINSIQRKYSETNYLKYDSARTEEIGHADEFWAQALALKEDMGDVMGIAMVDMRKLKTGREQRRHMANSFQRLMG